MSEQAPPPEDTPTLASPEEAGTAEQAAIDYQKRYEDLHPEYTRVTQEAATLRQQKEWMDSLLTSDDPDTRRTAAQALGYELEDTDEDVSADPNDALVREVAAIKAQLATQAQEAQQAQQVALVEQHIEQQLGALGDLNERQRKYVANTAFAMPPTADGMPDIKGAYDQWVTDMNEEKLEWAKTKKAPHFSAVGEAGTQQPDLGTREGKSAYILGRMKAEEM